jgi:CheY-like chemotaxis protein
MPPARILIVDDEPYVRDMLAKILAKKGHDVTPVPGGAEALAALGERVFDVVLSDVVMPGMDGFDLLRRIKASHPGVKVVVLTGYARKQSISDFLLYGADEYLAKPFQVHQLLAAVERATSAPTVSAAPSTQPVRG